ncbi:PKD-like domain-containing protein, partial [Cylindrospermopsis raciborskii]|uniref:PKD-like domain-containing protein n=1 Tax=Cylindrospermopsis raciborskii TaxID=77022 RepID=UPI003570A042
MSTATYLVTPTSGSCVGAQFSVVVSINPRAIISGITQVVCTGGSIEFTPGATNGVVPVGTTYTLISAVGSAAGVTSTLFTGSRSSIIGTFTNTTNGSLSVTYTLQPTSNGCVGANFTVVVTVNATPSVTNMTVITCEGVVFQATPVQGTNGTVPANTTYSWSIPTYTSGLSGGVGGSGNAITGTLQNSSNVIQTATYLVVPTSPSGSCVGATFTLNVGVNPTAEIVAFTAVTCGNVAFAVTPSATNVVPSGTTYAWSSPSGSGFTGGASGSGSTINGTLLNTVNVVSTATYLVTPTSGSCVGAQFSVVVSINPRAIISGITQVVCTGGSI